MSAAQYAAQLAGKREGELIELLAETAAQRDQFAAQLATLETACHDLANEVQSAKRLLSDLDDHHWFGDSGVRPA